MKTEATLSAREFTGVRVQIDSPLSFDEVLRRLNDLVGRASLSEINALSRDAKDQADYARLVESSFAGKSGFMRFGEVDHGGWIGIFGIHRKAVRWILGNPLIAITMMRHDIRAGLFAPIEFLLTDVPDGDGSSFVYVRPSSLIAIDGKPELRAAAEALDAKFELLVKQVTTP